ncbi:hypothetical protein FKM82_015046 [Ascaphus truei]
MDKYIQPGIKLRCYPHVTDVAFKMVAISHFGKTLVTRRVLSGTVDNGVHFTIGTCSQIRSCAFHPDQKSHNACDSITCRQPENTGCL